MNDTAQGTEGARVEKYGDDQVACSRGLLGREPEGADLQACHAAPADGLVIPEHDSNCQPTGGTS